MNEKAVFLTSDEILELARLNVNIEPRPGCLRIHVWSFAWGKTSETFFERLQNAAVKDILFQKLMGMIAAYKVLGIPITVRHEYRMLEFEL